MHRKHFLAMAALLTCLYAWSPAHGQSLPKDKQAELAFEIRMDQLRKSPLHDVLAENIKQIQQQVQDDVDLEKVNKVWGAIQFPDSIADMAALERMQPGDPFPMEMFVRMEFVDSASADAAMAKMKESSEEVTMGGKTFMKPKDGEDAPPNIMGHRLNSTTIQAGTEMFLTNGGGMETFSSGLGNAWKSFGDEPIRIAFDMDNARDLIDEALGAAGAQAPPFITPVLDALGSAKNVRLAMDLKDGGNLLQLSMLGPDAEEAEKLRGALDGLLGFAKMGGQGGIEQMRGQNPEMADVASAIMQSLNAKRDGDDVQITIPKPDGFEKAIKGMMGMMGNNF